MRSEADLVKKIQELKEIKPRKDWVLLTKNQILGEEAIYRGRASISFFPVWKPALATVTVLGVLFGILIFSQNSLPGDFLYPLKKISERSQAVFVSEEEKPAFQLKLANEKLEDLTKTPAKNLAPALSEFQASISEAAKEITEVKKLDVEEIVAETQKLEENKEKVKALGIIMGETKELDNAISQLVEREIKDLENRTLAEKQQVLLEGAREDYKKGNYSLALEKILFLSYLTVD
jgi:hypothetical protein